MIDTLIFDLDGTLLDTLLDLQIATNYALNKYNLPSRSYEEVRTFVGNGNRKLMERAIGDNKHVNIDEILNVFYDYYKEHLLDNTKPYDGIIQTLNILKEQGYKLAVVSNKFNDGLVKIVDSYFKGIFDISIGENEKEGIKKKPAPDMVYKAIDELKSNLNKSIYIGDSETDILTARNSKLPIINVTWGFRSKEELIGLKPDYMIDKPNEIINILKEINNE